jgi:hypothetical protein
MEINFNPAIGMNSKIYTDPQIKAQLEALSLQPTGTKEGDLQAIKEALEKTKPDSSNKTTQSPQTPPEIAAFMGSIGLEPTNSKEGDEIAVQNRLNQLESQATNESEFNSVKSLRSVWAQLTSSASSGESSFQQQSTSTDSFAGQNQLAKINKWFLVK